MPAPRKPEPQMYIARTSGVVRVNGRNVTYTRNRTIVPAGAALLRAAPDKFIALRPDMQAVMSPPEILPNEVA